jgi:uracil-DNA glycosylase
MAEFDPGPPARIADVFDRVPEPPVKEHFWFDWGPIFYRGRLDGSARLLCIASDPGATERVAGRTLVGNAGQRVQGFLTRLGLTRSYVCLNAWPYSLVPDHASDEQRELDDPTQMGWRNELYDEVATPQLQAIVAFGGMAQDAVALWSTRPDVKVFKVPHPSSRSEPKLLDAWRAAVDELRGIVTPDDDGDNTGANYGPKFLESDYAAIPHGDLPFGAPAFLGDDAWRRAKPGPMNSVNRPPGDRHTLIWQAPDSGA